MSGGAIFFRLVPDMVINLSDFLDAAALRWPTARLVRDQRFDGRDTAKVYLETSGEGLPFSLQYSGESIWTDGDPDQAALVAVWLRSLLPEDLDPPLLMSDDTYGTLRELPANITPDEVWDRAAWVDESDYAATHPSE